MARCMSYFVYLLRSLNFDKWYIGSTSSIDKRLKRHISGRSIFTKKFMPWEVFYFEKFETKSEALKREYYFKSPKGFLELKRIKSGGVA